MKKRKINYTNIENPMKWHSEVHSYLAFYFAAIFYSKCDKTVVKYKKTIYTVLSCPWKTIANSNREKGFFRQNSLWIPQVTKSEQEIKKHFKWITGLFFYSGLFFIRVTRWCGVDGWLHTKVFWSIKIEPKGSAQVGGIKQSILFLYSNFTCLYF